MITKEQAAKVVELLKKEGKSTFDSHCFIETYRANYEHEYILMLSENDKNSNKAFQIVNSQIARFISSNSAFLRIEKLGKADSQNDHSQNDHGKDTENAQFKILS